MTCNREDHDKFQMLNIWYCEKCRTYLDEDINMISTCFHCIIKKGQRFENRIRRNQV